MGKREVQQTDLPLHQEQSSGFTNPLSLCCDGAFKKDTAAIGVILKCSNETIVEGIAEQVLAVSSLFSEAAVIREACLLASATGLRNVTKEKVGGCLVEKRGGKEKFTGGWDHPLVREKESEVRIQSVNYSEEMLEWQLKRLEV
ncbi:unnamed protein product [Ilex paraguariensis]|uniref:RNase H type-1 domain-containing protein n=1 Tax=Ilex paraguariensis TaxID=185542 RepID=A0ABC8R7V7_9AQUA